MNDRPGQPGVDLEVERLVLHDPTMSGSRAERLRGLVESELARLLSGATIDAGASAALVRIMLPPTGSGPRSDDHQLATSLATAIVRAIEEGPQHDR
jgi:hypothetical protein